MGRAVPGRIEHSYLNLASPIAAHTLERWLRRRDRDAMCINDTDSDGTDLQPALEEFLEEYYPLPSQWEHFPADHEFRLFSFRQAFLFATEL